MIKAWKTDRPTSCPQTEKETDADVLTVFHAAAVSRVAWLKESDSQSSP